MKVLKRLYYSATAFMYAWVFCSIIDVNLHNHIAGYVYSQLNFFEVFLKIFGT